MLDLTPERFGVHDVPDRAPDGQARRAGLPCSYCGRDPATNLYVLEAMERNGYAKTECFVCRLTDLRR